MSEQELAARLRRLEDREEIRTLVGRYSISVDDHDFDTLASLFAPDAVYCWHDRENVTEGGAAVAALLKSRIEPGGPSFHVNHDQLVDWDARNPDRASGLVLCHAETSSANGHNIAAIRYRDQYVRHQGRWLFQERSLGFLYNLPVKDYPGVLQQRDRIRLPGLTRAAHWPAYNL